MSKSQRTKGAGGERELCGILTDALGKKVKRVLGQARDGGHDISLSPFMLEVKRRRRIAVYEWFDQVVAASGAGSDTPVLVMRGDGREWLVMMRLDDWIKLA